MSTNKKNKNSYNTTPKKPKKEKISRSKLLVRVICIVLALLCSGGLLTYLIDIIIKLL